MDDDCQVLVEDDDDDPLIAEVTREMNFRHERISFFLGGYLFKSKFC
jgi:hypothetical protein